MALNASHHRISEYALSTTLGAPVDRNAVEGPLKAHLTPSPPHLFRVDTELDIPTVIAAVGRANRRTEHHSIIDWELASPVEGKIHGRGAQILEIGHGYGTNSRVISSLQKGQ